MNNSNDIPPDSAARRALEEADERITSEDLAAIIVDALLRANLVREQDVAKAIAIATEEIDVRKALGDY